MEIAKKMMKRGMSTAEIQGCITNLTYEEIERLKARAHIALSCLCVLK